VVRDLSYRVRVPLTLAVVSGASALVLALLIAAQTYRNVQEDLATQGQQLGRAMISALTAALRHDDVWLAYTILRGSAGPAGIRRPTLVLLDREDRIFAADQPGDFPTARLLRDTAPAFAGLLEDGDGIGDGATRVYINQPPDRLTVRIPLLSDANPIGALLLSFSYEAYWTRFREIIVQGAVYTLGVMTLTVLGGWYLGGRLVRPLSQLAGCMERVGHENLREIQCPLPAGQDELGQLSNAFRRMLEDLREKEGLERQIVASERLAAVGRLAAGVAHEINNPLGGMLVALDTLKSHGELDDRTRRTIDLLERGVEQIRDTVSALLVESRREPRELGRQDLEDVHTLVESQLRERSGRLQWDNTVDGSLPLPSTLVRQILLNLLLNAIQAVERGGRIACRIGVEAKALVLAVENEGPTLAPEILESLFEPYASFREEGRGLGLWVTYQIVAQLRGSIEVESAHGMTRFRVYLPLLTEEPSHEITPPRSAPG